MDFPRDPPAGICPDTFGHTYDLGYVSAWHKYLCPSIHAVPAATKSSAAHALNTKEAMPMGIPPPKTGLAQKGGKWECHLWLLEGGGVGQYYAYTRETQHVM
eukprot:8885856-Ditylum_brightwellii.AAC.1